MEVWASDGRVGVVDDLYIEDGLGAIRYFVVDTGGWLMGQRVLVATSSVTGVAHISGRMSVALTRAQVQNGPAPESRLGLAPHGQHETADQYEWPHYHVPDVYEDRTMLGVFVWAPPLDPVREPAPEDAPAPTLRSVRELSGYHILATDGKIGHVDDFIIEQDDCRLRHLIVDTRNWLPGRRVLVEPEMVTGIEFRRKTISVNVNRQGIRGAPEFDPASLSHPAREEAMSGL